MMNKILNIIKISINIFIWILGIFIILITISQFFIAIGAFNDESYFSGLGFIPWSILLLCESIFMLLILVMVKKRLLIYIWLIVFILINLFSGDISFQSFYNKIETKINTLSVITTNLRYYSFGAQNILRKIRSSNVDVILLSENRPEPETADLWLQSGYQYLTGRIGETAILTRLVVLSFTEIELPSFQASLSLSNIIKEQPNNPHRSFIHAKVIFNNKIVNLISIRFIAGRAADSSLKENLLWGKYLLKAQAMEVSFFINYLSKINEPLIFGGDLNATPSSFVIKKISKYYQDAYFEDHFIGWPTFSTIALPLMRLDYLFHNNYINTLQTEHFDWIISDHKVVGGKFFVN